MSPFGPALALALALTACAGGGERADRAGLTVVSRAQAGFGAEGMLGAIRDATNLPPLGRDGRLDAAARRHAEELSRRGQLSHRGADGSGVMDRVRRRGYAACFAAENLARGQVDPAAAFASWMGSPDHRANILSDRVTAYGFARSGTVWVLVLAAPC